MMAIEFIRDSGETAMSLAIIVVLALSMTLAIDSYVNFIPAEYPTAILIVAVAIGFAGIGYSLADGIITSMETGFVAGIALLLGLLYNLDIFTDPLYRGMAFAFTLLLSIGAIWLVIKQARE